MVSFLSGTDSVFSNRSEHFSVRVDSISKCEILGFIRVDHFFREARHERLIYLNVAATSWPKNVCSGRAAIKAELAQQIGIQGLGPGSLPNGRLTIAKTSHAVKIRLRA